MGALLLTLSLGMTGCGGDDAEPSETGVGRLVAALLASVPRDSIVQFAADDTLHVSSTTRQFYRRRLYRSAWTDGHRILPVGQRLYETIGGAHEDGLDPASYGWEMARRMVAVIDSAGISAERRADLLGELDLVLSEGFMRYARDLSQGTVDPTEGGLDWRIARDTVFAEEGVLRAARTQPLDQVLDDLRPAAPEYARLMAALASYRAVEVRGGWPQMPVPEGRPRRDPTAATVVALRQRLIVGEDADETRLALQGEGQPAVFDDSLHAALAHFQSRNAIDEDGALGANTLRELNRSVQDRIDDLRLNLDRWRWLPRDLGRRYVVVNVAGYELELIEDGKAALTMNVVVGKEGSNTPLFADTIEYLVANPSWNVPPSIGQDEIIPAVRRDPGYLSSRHFDVLRGNKVVDASSIDFSRPTLYSFRQRPGADNALGQLKFMLPNEENIYLHDTPAGGLFSLSDRAFSHGCIRLEHPEDLAHALLERVGDTSPEELAAVLATGKETTIRFREGVPVYLLYFTAWAGVDGSVHFPHDVYGRDQGLETERSLKLDHPAPAGGASAG